jgi:hypothetical protein
MHNTILRLNGSIIGSLTLKAYNCDHFRLATNPGLSKVPQPYMLQLHLKCRLDTSAAAYVDLPEASQEQVSVTH